MKLTTLKTVLQGMPAPRVQTLAARPQMVERLRGGAGVRDRAKIKARDCGLCQECKRHGRARPGSVVDHITPLWEEGTDEDSNKELLCVTCHDAKSKVEAARRAGH
jgi:5-methylcytosine-specific restriction protein A